MEPSRNYVSDGCRKCNSSKPYIILDKVHLECKECFLESCNKKIRSTIGKSKLVRNNDSILISYSGGPSSCALADLINNSIGSDTRREQKFRPSLLHIDMQSILHPTSSLHEFKSRRRAELVKQLEHIRLTYPNWPIYWTSIEMCVLDTLLNGKIFARYKCPGDIDDCESLFLSNDDAHLSLHQSISNAGDKTDQQQFVADRCIDLICRVANEINLAIEQVEDRFKYVFTGSTSTQLANDLLIDVILGRGANIRSTVNVCDRRHPVPIVRPLRDFSKKEIAFYLKARSIEPSVQPNLMTMADSRSSIQKVTESFLTKLYVDYPSTYSTLLKTGNKMV